MKGKIQSKDIRTGTGIDEYLSHRRLVEDTRRRCKDPRTLDEALNWGREGVRGGVETEEREREREKKWRGVREREGGGVCYFSLWQEDRSGEF